LSLRQYNWDEIWLPWWAVVLVIVAAVAIIQLPLLYAVSIVLLSALFVSTLIQPLIGLGVALIAGPMGAYENIVLGSLPIESGQLLFFVAVAGWLVRGVLDRRIIIHRAAINTPLAIFIAIAALTLLDAVSVAFGIKELVKWLELAIAMLMVVDLSLDRSESGESSGENDQFVVNRQKTRTVLAILLIAGVSQAIIGIWQFGIRGEGPDHFVILDRFYRAFGTFMQPNPFGGFMAVTASLAIGTLAGLVMDLVNRRRERATVSLSQWAWFGFIAVCAALSSMALLMSWSRGAWLGFAAAMAVFLFFFPKRLWKGILLLSMLALMFFASLQLDIMPQSIIARFGSLGTDQQIGDVRGELVTIENYAVVERLAHWQAGFNMARENLATGVGFGNYERAYPDYALMNWPFALGHAHNYYINLLAEVGVVGTLAYLLLWAVIFIQAIRILRHSNWPVRGIALGLIAAWTAITVHHAVDKLYVNNMFIYFGVMLGLQQVLDIQND
jgi:putative inorganic carbon (HCO3(-)) transporter